VAVLATTGGDLPALAAKAATSTIPIVFGIGSDPVKVGLVASLNRPGGNMTGVTVMSYALEAKRLGLLAELVPSGKIIAALINPNGPAAETQERDLQTAGQADRQTSCSFPRDQRARLRDSIREPRAG